jgi:hypothetical protein
MRKTLIITLIVITAISLGYISGNLYYKRASDRVVEALDLKSYTLWELEKQAAILKQIKEKDYQKADETRRELKIKKHYFDKEFDGQMAKAKWAARYIGSAVAIFLLLLSYAINKLWRTKKS